MRCVYFVLIAGCGFTSQPAPALPDPVGDPGDGAGGPGAAPCDVSDPQIKLCVAFSGDAKPRDLATPPHAAIDADGISPIAGIATTTAGGFTAASHLRFAESPDFDVAELTLEMWISPQIVPARNRLLYLVDNNTQYSLTYDGDQSVRCGIGPTVAVSDVQIATGTWHHVACTYSLADHQLRVHVDGEVSGCGTINNGIPRGGMEGIAIGGNFGGNKYTDNFVGSLDGVHVYGRALSPTEICEGLGRSDCNLDCGGEGPGARVADPLGPR